MSPSNEVRPQGHARHNVRSVIPKTRTEKQAADGTRYNTSHTLVGQDVKSESHDARFLSPDLVDDVFGSFLPPDLISLVVENFLEINLLRAYEVSTHNQITQDRFFEAAGKAAYDARYVGCYDDKRGKKQKEGFSWEWNLGPDAHLRSEAGAARFLNKIATKAFEAIYRISPRALGTRWPQWRFARPPHPFPVADLAESVDQRPGGCVLPIAAWMTRGVNSEALTDQEFVDGDAEEPDEYAPAEGEEEEEGEEYWALPAHKATPSQEADETARVAWSHYQSSPEIDDQNLDEAYANWSQTRMVLELKHSELYSAIRQAHLYLRTLHRAQPFLVSGLGIALTRKHLCLLRTDPVGFEECPLELSTSRGVLDTIRVALGFVIAHDSDLGYNAQFRWKNTESVISVSRSQVSAVGSKKQKIQKTYIRRCIDTIPRGTEIYKVAAILSNTSSIRGRGSTVYKVTADEDPSHYFALKVAWVDSCSDSKEQKILLRALKAKVEHVLLPAENDCWLSGLRTDWLRGDADGRMFGSIEMREETFSLTPYKLSLPQFRRVADFVNGLICVLKGIQSLFDKAELLHADVSFGNIMFDDPAVAGTALMDAWLIDLDNSCDAAEEAEESAGDDEPWGSDTRQKKIITGTAPFMAIEIMIDVAPRRIRHDVESVFYVLFLFFFTFNGPATEASILYGNSWPDEIRAWTNGSDLPTMGRTKYGYFSFPESVRRNLECDTQPFWRPGPSGKTYDAVYKLVDGAYCLLWEAKPSSHLARSVPTAPQKFIEYLEKWLIDHSKDLPF